MKQRKRSSHPRSPIIFSQETMADNIKLYATGIRGENGGIVRAVLRRATLTHSQRFCIAGCSTTWSPWKRWRGRRKTSRTQPINSTGSRERCGLSVQMHGARRLDSLNAFVLPASQLKDKMWWQNLKLWCAIGCIVTVFLIIILAQVRLSGPRSPRNGPSPDLGALH